MPRAVYQMEMRELIGTCDLKEHCSLRTAEPYARLFPGHVPCLFVMGPSVRQVSAQEAGKKRDNRQRNGPECNPACWAGVAWRSWPFPRAFVGHGCDFEGKKRSSVVIGIPAKSKEKWSIQQLASAAGPEAPLLRKVP